MHAPKIELGGRITENDDSLSLTPPRARVSDNQRCIVNGTAVCKEEEEHSCMS